jgi:hypothetical protein
MINDTIGTVMIPVKRTPLRGRVRAQPRCVLPIDALSPGVLLFSYAAVISFLRHWQCSVEMQPRDFSAAAFGDLQRALALLKSRSGPADFGAWPPLSSDLRRVDPALEPILAARAVRVLSAPRSDRVPKPRSICERFVSGKAGLAELDASRQAGAASAVAPDVEDAAPPAPGARGGARGGARKRSRAQEGEEEE